MIDNNNSLLSRIRPVILAGGLGTRLRPRTNYLPKPLLPVNGRPILWYVLNSLQGYGMQPPIVIIDYKGELIRSYFERDNVEFRSLPNRTMAEAILEIAENDPSESFLGMSSDVLIPRKAIAEILKDYSENGGKDTVLFAKLPKIGHKKWEFCVNSGYLDDIIIKKSKTPFERVLLIMTRTSLQKVRDFLGNLVNEETIPEKLKSFQTGWILILKSMISQQVNVCARIIDIPVCNINVPADFEDAELFVQEHLIKQ